MVITQQHEIYIIWCEIMKCMRGNTCYKCIYLARGDMTRLEMTRRKWKDKAEHRWRTGHYLPQRIAQDHWIELEKAWKTTQFEEFPCTCEELTRYADPLYKKCMSPTLT